MDKQAGSPLFARHLRMRAAHSTIHTARLLLRPLHFSDAKDLHAYAKDPQVARFVLWEPHRSLSHTRSILRRMMLQSKLEGLHTKAIVLADSQRMVGTIGLVWLDAGHAVAELGFSLAADCWNQGYMSEALSAYLRWLFTYQGYNRLEARHDARNPASGAVMKKAGMQKEGLLRERLYYKGSYASLMVYAAVREEWLAQHPSEDEMRNG